MNRRFFINPSQTEEPEIIIPEPDANHIKNVLRLKQGDSIILFDGKGKELNARIEAFSSQGVHVSILNMLNSLTESPIHITIAQGYLKDKKMDILIRQLTELGINTWIPFFAQRSIPNPDPKRLAARTLRWKKIAKESLKQCRRTRIPEIFPGLTYDEMLNHSKSFDLKLIFWEKDTAGHDSVLKENPDQKYKKIFAVLGPEGGLSKKEVEKAADKGFITASLGPRILRAETATIAASTLLQHFFGDLK